MKKKKLRAGIIGSGFSASFHFESLKRVSSVDIDIVGVFSPTKIHRDKFAQQRNIKSFDTLDGLFDSCDVAHICVPVAFHEKMIIEALNRGVYPIVEKPLTGFCGDNSESFRGDTFPKEKTLEYVHQSIDRILEAEKKSNVSILYAENWVYTPAIQREREIIEKTGSQILWIHGEEAHSGSHSSTYGYWKYSGGGVMLNKGCHPLTAALYLKRKEGLARNNAPIHPKSVSGRIHTITSLDNFEDKGHIRTGYYDIDDFSMMHIEFEDGTIADIFASDIILGGIHNRLVVAANNHRTICNIIPNNTIQTYNPVEEYFKDIYVVEKIGTKQGWSNPALDEDFLNGFPQEMEAFYRTAAYQDTLESNSSLAADAISTIFSAYLSAEHNGEKAYVKNY